MARSLTRKDGEMILGLRPERFSVASSSEDGPSVPATVELTDAFVGRLDPRVRTGPARQLEPAVDVTRAHFLDPEDDRSLRSPS